jgi:lauroyl/myristoyl acyltransferase
MVTLTTGIMFLVLICMHFWVWEILRRQAECAPTACEVVRDCPKFEKQ